MRANGDPPVESGQRRRWTLEIPGKRSEVCRARDLACRIAEDLRLGAVARFRLRVALHEAVANAVVHGCRGPRDRVRVVARSDGQRIAVEVIDPGGRYEPADVPDDPYSLGGRGNALIRGVSDEVAVDVHPRETRLRFSQGLTRPWLRRGPQANRHEAEVVGERSARERLGVRAEPVNDRARR
jgi:anti-sigma regulatory factor (Ser/Thr protein kinase)